MKRVAIVQSNYIPWKGYFDMIAAVDEFILYDDMQYTRRDWRNRNRIKTPNGLEWLTVPVDAKGKYFQKIKDTRISGHEWVRDHWRSLVLNYSRAGFFEEVSPYFESIYLDHKFEFLSDLNRKLIEVVCQFLGITTVIRSSTDFMLIDGKTERLIDLCLQVGGEEYITGPAAKDYVDVDLFQQSGIELTWFDYNNYRAYPQLWGEFQHGVTMLDLLFNCGKESHFYMKYVI